MDEPDIVKTDGTRILVVQEQQLTYVDVSSGDPVKTDSIQIDEGWGHELFFQGDRALLFTNGGSWGGPIPVEPLIVDDAEAEFAETSPIIDEQWWGPAASIIEIDLSDPENLEIAGHHAHRGQLPLGPPCWRHRADGVDKPPDPAPVGLPLQPGG